MRRPNRRLLHLRLRDLVLASAILGLPRLAGAAPVKIIVSGGSTNPTLTIVTLAIRQAEFIARQLSGGAI